MLKNKYLFTSVMALFLLTSCADLLSVQDETASLSAKSLYIEGELALARHELAEAVQHFEALDTRFPFSPYMPQAQTNLIYAYYDLQQVENVLSVANAYLSLHGHGAHADYAYYMRGLVQFERHQTWLKSLFKREPALHDLDSLRKAYDDFMLITQRYPQSVFAPDAARRTLYIRNQLAESELLAAKYYARQHATIAALNRLSYLIENFPDAPQYAIAIAMKKKLIKQMH